MKDKNSFRELRRILYQSKIKIAIIFPKRRSEASAPSGSVPFLISE